jgi:hypothetical protein
MTAAREGYEAALRVNEAHVIGHAEAQRASAEAARRLALADHERATKALAKAEREAELRPSDEAPQARSARPKAEHTRHAEREEEG